MMSAASLTATPRCDPRQAKADALRVLAFVHLRNIHGSTGAGRVARQLTEHLALRDDVDLRILADAADKDRILPLVGGPWADFRYHTFPADTSRQQMRWFATQRPAAETYWNDAQVVFCTAESYVPARKARLAVTIHDAAYFEASAHRQDRAFAIQKLKWQLLFRQISRKADMIHTVSHFSADRLSHFFPQMKSRIRVVHNAVSPHFFEAVPASGLWFLEDQSLAGKDFVLIPGGLHFRKNAELILDACPELLKRFPGLQIVIVNHSNPAYLERARKLGPGLRVAGFVDDDALHALYSAAAVVWFPSRYEGFGLPVIEAMACGAPVVASNSSSLPEIAGDSARLVDPSDTLAHVNAISDLLSDSRACAHLARAGRRRAADFTWQASAEQLRHHFGSLI